MEKFFSTSKKDSFCLQVQSKTKPETFALSSVIETVAKDRIVIEKIMRSVKDCLAPSEQWKRTADMKLFNKNNFHCCLPAAGGMKNIDGFHVCENYKNEGMHFLHAPQALLDILNGHEETDEIKTFLKLLDAENFIVNCHQCGKVSTVFCNRICFFLDCILWVEFRN